MLYIVGTSIGNIEDTSLRTVKTLCNSDIILCEDTQSFDSYYKKIQSLFARLPQKKQQIVHFHKENEFKKISWVIGQLNASKMISLVSESGLPAISDPGHDLIIHIIKSKLLFTVIPGPTAFTIATILSGFPTEQILFLGFLPKKESHIVKLFIRLDKYRSKHFNPTIVFYESPHRIEKTLQIISEVLPDAKVSVAREMTKKFEETLRGKPLDLEKKLFKGEITVVLKLM